MTTEEAAEIITNLRFSQSQTLQRLAAQIAAEFIDSQTGGGDGQ